MLTATPGARTGLLAPIEPRRIGRYTLEAKLGEGGMGVVYRARDGVLDRSLAIKLLHATLGVRDVHARDRLQREARAMAQISHPNVVQIHDVGVHDNQVFVVMELIRGRTLREWMAGPSRRPDPPRPWREALAVMIQAGQGLVAAHAVSIVHRDFKPDNVFVGDDGRVCVGDFGLAQFGHNEPPAGDSEEPAATDELAVRDSLTLPGTLLGTPAYMAPEQHCRAALDERADQFSFCIALWEALYGERPFAGSNVEELARNVVLGRRRPAPMSSRVPGWLRHALERGLLPEPDLRFADMRGLLGALERGNSWARIQRVLLALLAVACVGVGAWVWRQADVHARMTACAAAGDAIDAVWNDRARERVRDAMIGTDVAYAATTADKVMPWLDGQAEAWRAVRTEVCLDADVRAAWDAETVERGLWCLDERHMELASLIDELTRSTRRSVQRAVSAAAGLERVAACGEASSQVRLPLPPPAGRAAVQAVRTRLAHARALTTAGAFDDALVAARAAHWRAERLAWPTLTATASYRVGEILEASGKFVDAEAALEQAYFLAAETGALGVAADAATKLTHVVGYRLARHADGRRWARLAGVAIQAIERDEGLRAANRLNNLGNVELSAGAPAEARALYERALAIRERVLGRMHPDVAISLNNVASTVHGGSADRRAARLLLERALAILEESLGVDHPSTARNLANLANLDITLGDYVRAQALLTRAVTIFEKALGPDHLDVAQAYNNLANIHHWIGDDGEAMRLHVHAREIRERVLGSEHPVVAESLAGLAELHLVAGDTAAASRLYEQSLAIFEAARGPDDPEVIECLVGLARIARDAGRRDEARAQLERARVLAERFYAGQPSLASPLLALANLELMEEHPAAAVILSARAVTLCEQSDTPPEKLAVARFTLARALWQLPIDAGRDRARARELAERAHEALRGARGQGEVVTEVERWLAERRAAD